MSSAARSKIHPKDLIKTWKIVKGDRVAVMSGKSVGHIGEVVNVIRKQNRVVVAGANLVKKHQAPTGTSRGGILQKEMPIHVSNVSLLDPKDGQPTRVEMKYVVEGDGSSFRKVRVSKRSGLIIEKPPPSFMTRKRNLDVGIKDTPVEASRGDYEISLIRNAPLTGIQPTHRPWVMMPRRMVLSEDNPLLGGAGLGNEAIVEKRLQKAEAAALRRQALLHAAALTTTSTPSADPVDLADPASTPQEQKPATEKLE
ncbi:hypothetical protein H696_00216 [Fonticula alba]|uniref:50S ribosomal protein L24 n=1 Tax=Fonticula alba TaxID=691883 RepID=A0A058ZFA1_FONAL|nr:hypothetical protein H696_00216 [Fonticula alba]KCV72631.1 hypothetical protein H696_00216 [Fonticula alba]|eukprot:XP_009492332.1 hypothetical protein H696_00216 [Fonticula alba]